MKEIALGPARVFPFGLVVALSLTAGVCWSRKDARDPRERKALELFWLMALPLGTLLAHVGYCLCSMDLLADSEGAMLLDFTGGGYLLYGAVVGALISLPLACRRAGVSPAELADRLAGPFLLLGAACALGEGLIGAGAGWMVEDWFQPENSMSLFASPEPEGLIAFFSRFPFAVRDPFYDYMAWAVFLPMAAVMLLGLTGLRKRPGGRGDRALFSLSWYAAARVFYESLRQDDIPKWGFVRVNQILSAVALVAVMICVFCRAGRVRPGRIVRLLGGALLVLLMEFALEKKINMLDWMTMDLCYLVSAVGCVLLFLGAGPSAYSGAGRGKA